MRFGSVPFVILLLALLAAGCVPAGPAAPATAAVSAAQSGIPSACTVDSYQPTPGPTERSHFPPPTEKDWTVGPADAYVTIIEYADYQCPGCAGVAPILKDIQAEHPEDVRLVYRSFPLMSIHDKAALSSQAAEAAGTQGKFWEMHDLLFTRQQEWSQMTPAAFSDWVIAQAASLSLDVDQFKTEMNSQAQVDKAKAAWAQGQVAQIPGTPFLLFNGRIYNGPLSYGNLSSIVALTLLEKRQFTTCPPFAINLLKTYLATIKTEKGDIRLELYANKAPTTVNNFVFLARQGWYDNVTFHRVIPGFVAQAGDPSGSGYGGPGYAFGNEIDPGLQFDQAGVLGMANSGPEANGSQFFITLGPAPTLDGKYTIFGRVLTGLDVVQQLTPRDPSQAAVNLPPGDKILTITIEEK